MSGHGGYRVGSGRKKKVTFSQLNDAQLDSPIELTKGHSAFTDEQAAILSQSPHVVSVTKKSVSYTLVFKEVFWRKYMQGHMPDKIFRDLGIDPQMLGENRIWGLVTSLRNLVAEGLPFTNGREPKDSKQKSKAVSAPITDADVVAATDLVLPRVTKPPRPPKNPRVVIPTVSRDDMQRLFHQVAYLSQEMEFLKKIILAGTQEKSI